MDTDIETTESLGMVAIYAAAAIESGQGEKLVITPSQTRVHGTTREPIYEYRVECPGLRVLVAGVAHQTVKVIGQNLQAVTRGLKRAAEGRAYTATELLRNGGA